VPIASWVKVAIGEWAAAAGLVEGHVLRAVNKGDNMWGEGIASQAIWGVVTDCATRLKLNVAPHDLRRTFAKSAHKGGSGIDRIQLSLGHASITTTERYLGVEQDLTDAPTDRLGLRLYT
jgi:integrase/recombinase XerD